jgi:hypothetical protein
MKIKYLTHNEINLQKWDNCIQNACNAWVYAESWYLDIVSPNWDALILDAYDYVMPLPVKRKFGISFLLQPPLTQQLGVFSKNEIEENIVEHFIKRIPYRSYHLNLNEQNSYYKGIMQPNLILNLNQNYQTIFSAYSTNTKRNIKKTQQAGIYVSESIEPQQFLDFYFTAMPDEAKPDRNLTGNIVQTGFVKNKLNLYAAFNQDHELTSVLCLLRSQDRLIYLLAASNAKGKELSCMSLIVDQVIQDFAETRVRLDFEGSKVESIARFYQGFGAQPTSFPQIKKNSIIQMKNFIKRVFLCK